MSANVMETMNIALPKSLKVFVQTQVTNRGYSSASEYIRELIRADHDERAWADLEAEIIKGLKSGKSTQLTSDDWKAIRKEIHNRRSKNS